MFKNTVIALAAVAALGSLAAPAFARDDAVFDGSYQDQVRDQAFVKRALQNQGINVVDVEEWNGLVRAYVLSADGTLTQQFFQPNSLTPVEL